MYCLVLKKKIKTKLVIQFQHDQEKLYKNKNTSIEHKDILPIKKITYTISQ